VVALGLSGVAAWPVHAQQQPVAPARQRPPRPGTPDKPLVILSYLVLALITGLVIGSALIPSKRGHQD